ncbi:hypothetical protein JYJ95_06605 [Corallococcus exiguus]|uniref:hypothetical protein n=1 Tax=Corallococcus exiguus TaxID=83462 RepID=UPI001A8E8777|nr:hypothetical protein [Corallococcus exiguus]MBN8466175.1 hypothetical protein [Corallococcus exiguus]
MIVTAADFVALGKRITDDLFPLRQEAASRVYEQLISAVEPHLVITDAGGAIKWFEYIDRARVAVRDGMRGVSPGFLNDVAELVSKYWKPAGTHAQRSLPFILNTKLRQVAEEDWNRAISSAQREDAKTTAISAGSVVEAIALDIIEPIAPADIVKLQNYLNGLPVDRRRNLSMSPKKVTPQEWNFAFLILALGHEGLKVLTERTHDIGHTLRDWRNYVHPDVSRNEPPLSPVDGRLAVAFAEKVIEEAEAWHSAGRTLVIPP